MCVSNFKSIAVLNLKKSRLYEQLQGQNISVEIGLANLKYKSIIKVKINLTMFV